MFARVLAYSLTGFIVVANLIALIALAGTPWAGRALAVFIFAIPPFMLFLAVARRFTTGDRQKDEQVKPKRAPLPGSKMLLALAALGVVGIAMIISSTALRNEGGFAAVGGWLIIVAFACLTIVPVMGICLLRVAPTLPVAVRSLVGRRRRLYRGMLRLLHGRLDEAAGEFAAYGADNPDDNRAPVMFSAVQVRRKRYQDAWVEAERALTINRTSEALVTRGQCWLLLGAREEALADILEALAINPTLFGASTLAGVALVELRRLDEAITMLESRPHARSTSPSLFTLAEAYRLRGLREEATRAYEQAIKLMPLNIHFRLVTGEGLWACALVELGKIDEADDRATATLAADPEDPLGLYASY